MTQRMLYWILMLLCLVFGIMISYRSGWSLPSGGGIIEFLLFLLLGWKCFGPPIEG